jgi:hypothetical protein
MIHVAMGQSLNTEHSIQGYKHWLTGHDPDTKQIIPAQGNDALDVRDSIVVAHVKFIVKQYGEMSFPINSKSSVNQEALKTDLSKSQFIVITYQSNQSFVLQLRQTGVHGGKHNHVVLPPSPSFNTVKIYLSEFKDGLTSLDVSDVSKFNFAFLSNNIEDLYAELIVKNFQIDGYRP